MTSIIIESMVIMFLNYTQLLFTHELLWLDYDLKKSLQIQRSVHTGFHL